MVQRSKYVHVPFIVRRPAVPGFAVSMCASHTSNLTVNNGTELHRWMMPRRSNGPSGVSAEDESLARRLVGGEMLPWLSLVLYSCLPLSFGWFPPLCWQLRTKNRPFEANGLIA